MSRAIALLLVVALLAAGSGCGRQNEDRNGADPGQQSAGDAAFSRGTQGTPDLDVQEFDYEQYSEEESEGTGQPEGEDVDDPGIDQDNGQGDTPAPQPTAPVITDGYVTEVFQPIPAETGTVVLNAGPIDNRTMAGDNAENQSFRAFWSFDVAKVRFSDVQEATLQFTHQETVGDPFRLDNRTLGIGGIQVWIVRTEEGTLPPYDPAPFVQLTNDPIFESPTEYDLTTYVKNIGDNMSNVNRVQVMVGFQRGTNRNDVADYMEWESATLTVTYAPH